MAIFAVACVWLAFVAPLIVAAIGRHRISTKVGALFGLALMLALNWLVVVLALGVLSAHSDSTSWPSPWLLAGGTLFGYALVVIAAFRRKLE